MLATSFVDIYDRAIFRFSDYDFMRVDIQAREDILEKYLFSAIADFSRVCKSGTLDYDLDEKSFINTLDDEMIEILSLGLDYYWFSSKVQNSELLRNSMSTKDYTFFSPANLMRELRNVRNDLKNEFKSAVTIYGYNHGDFAALGERG